MIANGSHRNDEKDDAEGYERSGRIIEDETTNLIREANELNLVY